MTDPSVHATAARRVAPEQVGRGRRAHARARGHLWSAVGVALTAVGCAPQRPISAERDTESLRATVAIGAPLFANVSTLRAGAAAGPRVILVHGTPGAATAWSDYLLAPPPDVELVALDRP